MFVHPNISLQHNSKLNCNKNEKLISKFLVMFMMVYLNHFVYAGVVPSNSNLAEVTKSAGSIKSEEVKKQKKFKIKWHQKLLMKVFGKKMVGGGAHWSNIVSLCTGILGFILLFLFFRLGLILCVNAVVFGIIGLTGDKEGKGMGIAGFVLGGIGLIISFIVILIVIAVLL